VTELVARYEHPHAAEKLVGYADEFDVRFNDRRKQNVFSYLVMLDSKKGDREGHRFIVHLRRSNNNTKWVLAHCETSYGSTSIGPEEMNRLAEIGIRLINGETVGSYGDALTRLVSS